MDIEEIQKVIDFCVGGSGEDFEIIENIEFELDIEIEDIEIELLRDDYKEVINRLIECKKL